MADHTGSATYGGETVTSTAAQVADTPSLRPLTPAAYIAGFHRLQGRYTSAFERLADLDRSPRPDDVGWSAAYRDALADLLLLTSAARELRPPRCLEETHAIYVQAANAFAATATLLLHQHQATGGSLTCDDAVTAMRSGVRWMDAANASLLRAPCR